MGIRHLATLLPMVAPLAHSRGHPALGRTRGLRNLQLFAESEEITTTSAATTDDVTEPLDAADADATEPETTISSRTYDPEECDRWVEKLVANDENKSGGLTGSEYHAFLSGIEDPPYIAEYFEAYEEFDTLPWVFRVVHKSLACHCEQLGFGKECCEGDDAEVLLEGLEDNGNGRSVTNRQAAVYKDLFCQQISHVLKKSIPSPAPTDEPSISPTKSPSSGPTPSPSTGPSAAPVTDGPTRAPSAEATLAPSKPTATLEPTEAPTALAVPMPEVATIRTVVVEEGEGNVGNNRGLVVVGIIAACLVSLVAILLFVSHRRRAREQDQLRKFAGAQAPEADLEVAPTAAEDWEWSAAPEAAPDAGRPGREPAEDDESSAPSVWSDSHDEGAAEELHEGHEDPGLTAGSALAAMGAASTVTARIGAINGNHHHQIV